MVAPGHRRYMPTSTMPQRAQIAPLTAGDVVIGTITVIDDVSERVGTEHELRKQIEAQQDARRAAEAALRVKDEFLATLSHEIRTPLSSVLGWARLLSARRLDPEQIAQGIEVIERNTKLQLQMVDDLLDTARIVAGKLRLEMKPIDLAPVALAALEVVAPAAAAKGIVVTQRLDCPARSPWPTLIACSRCSGTCCRTRSSSPTRAAPSTFTWRSGRISPV
jgi:signal transduction histidine kinase